MSAATLRRRWTGMLAVGGRAVVVGLALTAAVEGGGCKETQTMDAGVSFEAYDGGEAFPDRRPKLTRDGVVLGFVSNNGSDSISVLDLTNREVLGTAPVGRDPVSLDGPHHLAVDRANGFVYVALAYPAPPGVPGPHAAHGSSARSGFVQRLALDDLRPLGEVRVDPNPGDIALSADGRRLVVTHFDLKKALDADAGIEGRRATLALIDPAAILASDSPEPVRITTCVAPHGLTLSLDGKTAFVACYGEDAIAVVDLEDPHAEPKRVAVGPGPGLPGQPSYGPYAAVASPDGKLLAVSDTESKDVRFFDTVAMAMTPVVVAFSGAPYFAAWSVDGTTVWVPTQGPDALVAIDAKTGATSSAKPLGKNAGCRSPHEAVLGPGATSLYVVCEGDHLTPAAVLALDPVTLELQTTFAVGVYPDRLAIAVTP